MNQQQLVLLQAALLLATAYFNAATVYNPLPVYVSGCDADEFETGDGNCTLSCTISTSHPLHYVYSYFQYIVAWHLHPVMVRGAVRTKSPPGEVRNHTISVQLFNYSAGYYVCSFQYLFLDGNFTQESEFAFRIANGTGRYINEKCDSASQCYALNAQCDGDDGHSVCNCNGLYDIPYSYDKTNVACLKNEDVGQLCEINKECEKEFEDYFCFYFSQTYGICECRSHYVFVKKTQRYMCLTQANLLESCVYDEQCYSNEDNNTLCKDDSICSCKYGYSLSDSLTTCNASPIKMATHSCTAEDFYNGGNCTLVCQYDPNEISLMSEVSAKWIYRPSKSYSTQYYLYNGSYEDYKMKLYLDDYNGGYYICQLCFKNNNETFCINEAFHISTMMSGSYLNEDCSSNEDCVALNSHCVYDKSIGETVCKCVDGYHSYYNDYCYTMLDVNEICNIDAECERENQAYKCIDYVCTCDGFMRNVSGIDGDMCLSSKSPHSYCTYDEECRMGDPNSICYYEICQCQSDYYESMNSGKIACYPQKITPEQESTIICSSIIILFFIIWALLMLRMKYGWVILPQREVQNLTLTSF